MSTDTETIEDSPPKSGTDIIRQGINYVSKEYTFLIFGASVGSL